MGCPTARNSSDRMPRRTIYWAAHETSMGRIAMYGMSHPTAYGTTHG